jgi:hypothetical protein
MTTSGGPPDSQQRRPPSPSRHPRPPPNRRTVPQQRTAEPGPTARPGPEVEGKPRPDTPTAVAAPSLAYLTLAELDRSEPRLALPAADCTALEPLAAAWFARGVSADYLTSALTAGLPEGIGAPIGLVRRRPPGRPLQALPSCSGPAGRGGDAGARGTRRSSPRRQPPQPDAQPLNGRRRPLSQFRHRS